MDIVYGILLGCALLGPLIGLGDYLSTRIIFPALAESIVDNKYDPDYSLYKSPIARLIFLLVGLSLTYLFQASIKEPILKVAQIIFSGYFIIFLLGFILAVVQTVFFAFRDPETDSYVFFKAKIVVFSSLFVGIAMIILYICGHPMSVENGFPYISNYLHKMGAGR